MRLLALALAALVTTPALAQEADRLDLIAMVVGGIADGSQFAAGPQGVASVVQLGAGQFKGTAPDNREVVLTITEPEPCIFLLHASAPPDPDATIRFDFNMVRSVSHAVTTDFSSLNEFTIALDGDEGTVQAQSGTAPMTPAGNTSTMSTSLTIEELEAASAALHALCPGPA